jgi:TonB family protein
VSAILLAASPLRAQETSPAVTRALADHRAAVERAAAIDEEIRAEREALAAEIEALETEKRELEGAVIGLEKKIAIGEAKHEEIIETNSEKAREIQGIAGSISSAARDLQALMRQSPLAALEPGRLERLAPYVDESHVGGPADIAVLGRFCLDEISFSSRVGVHSASYLDRSGTPRGGRIVTLGKLTTLYEHTGETGFLLYAPADQKLSAFSKRTSRGTQNRIRSFVSGQDETAPVDLSFGRELRRVAREERLTVRTRKGGAVMLAIVIAGLMWLVFRWFDKRASRRVRGADVRIARVLPYASKWGAWAARPQTLSHRVALAAIFLMGLAAYLRGVTVLGQGEPDAVEVNLVNLVSLAPPPIAGRRVPRSMAPASRLAVYVPSKNVTKASMKKTEFEPELDSPSLSSPFAEGTPDIDISLDLSNLMNEEVEAGSEVVFESYELDQPPQAVVKIPPPYPHQARERGVEGAVQVKLLVHQDGTVGQVFIVDARPQGLFEDSVKKSLHQWRFNPGKIDGKTVTAWVVTTIHFDLN